MMLEHHTSSRTPPLPLPSPRSHPVLARQSACWSRASSPSIPSSPPSRPSPPAAALELIAAASCSCNCNCSCNCSCRRAIVGTSWCPSWVSPSSHPGGPSEASQPALTRQSQQFVWYRVAKSQHCTNCKRFYSFSSSVAPTRPELSRQSQL